MSTGLPAAGRFEVGDPVPEAREKPALRRDSTVNSRMAASASTGRTMVEVFALSVTIPTKSYEDTIAIVGRRFVSRRVQLCFAYAGVGWASRGDGLQPVA